MSATVRRRRRTVEERIGAQLRHGKPGDLQGRGEPLKRDRGAIVSRAGGPSGGDSGTVIEHLTMEAVAGQTIADGGGTVQWGTILPPPTERRGFRTASATLAADGAVGAIPIDVGGRLIIHLGWRWTSYRAKGNVTITRTRNGVDVSRTYDLGVIRSTEPAPTTLPGWTVKPDDTISIDLPNDSGAGQTLAEAEIVLDITEVNSPTSDVPVPTPVPDPTLSSDDLSQEDGDTEVVTTVPYPYDTEDPENHASLAIVGLHNEPPSGISNDTSFTVLLDLEVTVPGSSPTEVLYGGIYARQSEAGDFGDLTTWVFNEDADFSTGMMVITQLARGALVPTTDDCTMDDATGVTTLAIPDPGSGVVLYMAVFTASDQDYDVSIDGDAVLFAQADGPNLCGIAVWASTTGGPRTVTWNVAPDACVVGAVRLSGRP